MTPSNDSDQVHIIESVDWNVRVVISSDSGVDVTQPLIDLYLHRRHMSADSKDAANSFTSTAEEKPLHYCFTPEQLRQFLGQLERI